MKSFFDTSVLVAAFWEDHPHHKASLNVFCNTRKKEASCAAHTLSEVYAVMTRLPVKPLLGPEEVMLFVQEIRDHLTVIALEEDDYYLTLQQAAKQGITGGHIYDALLLRCAIKTKAETLYTWNLKHFAHSTHAFSGKVKTP
jgi:predicted nucleic acid-binding protein